MLTQVHTRSAENKVAGMSSTAALPLQKLCQQSPDGISAFTLQPSDRAAAQRIPYPFVRLPDDYFSNLSFYLEIDGVRLEQFKRVVYVNDSAAILSLLRSTDVVRLGPGLSAPDFAEYGVRTIPIRNCQVQINVGWIQRSREMLSTEAQAFVKMLDELYPKSEE